MHTAIAPAWMTGPEAQEYLNVTDKTLRRYVASGKLPAYRMGGRLLRFKVEDLDALMCPVPTVANIA